MPPLVLYYGDMNYQITYTQITSTSAVEDYVQKKIVSTLIKFADASGASSAWRLNIEIGRDTQHHRKGDVWFAEVTGETSYGFVRVRDEGSDIHEAIDLVEDDLRAKLTRSKGKLLARADRAARRVKNMIRLSRLARFFRRGRDREEGL